MPIRTNRGRAAVYRRLWSWPLRSPAHLVGTLVMVVAIVVSAGIVIPRLLGDPGSAGASPGAGAGATTTPGTSYSSTAGPPQTRLTAPLVSPTTAPPAPEALNVAEEWAAAWVDHPQGTTIDEWLERLRPLTTEEYLPLMRSVDLANVSATRVTGKPKATESFTSSVKAEVPTDGPTLSITVIKTDAGWRVSRYDQVG
ncbi:hypothetical protein ABZ639_31135 [Saccharomonospora sp. NPDC006951]